MRAVFVVTIIVIGCFFALKRPLYALLLYLWFAYFRPDYYVGYLPFIWELNLSYWVGLWMVVLTFLTGQKFRFGIAPVLLAMFFAHTFVSSLVSMNPEGALLNWKTFAPVMVTCYLMLVLINDEWQYRLVLVTIAISLAFEAAKQGWLQFVINPGGQNFNEHPMLGDNNGAAIGMFMIVPILVALARTARLRNERFLHRFLAGGVLYRALMTYSRGGFLACTALGLHYLARSRKKFVAIVAVGVTAALITPVLPDAFWSRMGTILTPTDKLEDEDTDGSIRGRLHFWRVARVMANDNPLIGVGFSQFNSMYDSYDFSDGAFGRARSVHSTWFGLLSEQGYPGFLIFVLLLGVAFRGCRRARRLGRQQPEFAEMAAYATAVEAGLLVFMIGGSFVIFQYTEMTWHYLALGVVLNRFVDERQVAPAHATGTLHRLEQEATSPIPAVARVGLLAPTELPTP